MEGVTVETVGMREVVQRVGDEVDRDEIQLGAAVHPDQRHAARQRRRESLQDGEEVIRAVHLVHLARLRVPDHDARAVDPPRDTAFGPHDLLRRVFRAEVRVVETRGLLEHVLAEHAAVPTGRSDRAHVVNAPDP